MTSKNVFSKIKKLLVFAYNNRYSDFHRLRFKKAEFNPLADFKSIKDIKKIPLLSKTELLNADPYELLFVKEKDVLCIRSTSGTTGRQLYLFNSKLDALEKNAMGITITKGMALINPVNIECTSLRGKVYSSWIPFGDYHNLPAAARMAAELQVDGINTSPTLAIILSNYLKDYPTIKKSLKYLYTVGELVTPAKKKFLQKLYPGVTILLNYACMETTTIASQCEFLAKKPGETRYHLRSEAQFTEIIDPDTGEDVKIGEKGEIVITNFSLLGTPLIRYRIGDMVNIVKGKKCPCGFPGPLLQVWGRINYDFVTAGGFELRREFLEKVINNLNFLKESFEAHIYESFVNNQPKIRIELNLALKEGIKESLVLKQKAENELLENWQVSPKLKLKNALEMGLIEPIKINFTNFPTTMKTKKALILHQV